MKQKEVLNLVEAINLVSGVGSERFKWAVYRTKRKLEKEQQEAMTYIGELKPEKLKTLQKEQTELYQNCKNQDERLKAYQNWDKKEELEQALRDFVNSEKYQEYLNMENTEFKPYQIDLKASDLKGIPLDNENVFWVLEMIGNNAENAIEEILKEREQEGKPKTK